MAGTCSITPNTTDLTDPVSAVENEDGLFDPRLSNYTTITVPEGSPGQGWESFGITINYDKMDSHLTDHGNMVVALVGCSLTGYEDNAGSPDLDTAFPEDIVATMRTTGVLDSVPVILPFSFAYGTQNSVNTFCAQSLPGIISGGRSNLLFCNLGPPDGNNGTGTVELNFYRLAANAAARSHAKLIIGHLYVGVEIPITLNPNTVAWSVESQNERFFARDLGAKNSEGTLVRQVIAEAVKITQTDIVGASVQSISGAKPNSIKLSQSFFDLVKVNTSYPVLFNAYPHPLGHGTGGVSVDGYNLTARQNFFSIYGFMDGPLEFQMGEYRDGLSSEYRARFRIRETR